MSENYIKLAPAYSLYYDRYYPYEDIVQWLTYSGTIPTARREWSYEVLTSSDDSFIARFREVRNAEQLRQILHFSPTGYEDFKLKLDIGPVYTHDMSQRAAQLKFEPCEREIVFDIDAGDYDRIRNCCSGAAICSKCWRFMELAVPILILFCRIYGFSNYFFAFSGRRGIHCWICDVHARTLPKDIRNNMLQAFDIITTDTNSVLHMTYNHANWLCRIIHDHIALKFFPQILIEQQWLDGDVTAYLAARSKVEILNDLGQPEGKIDLAIPIFRFLYNVLSIYSCLLSLGLPVTAGSGRNVDSKFKCQLTIFIGKLTMKTSSAYRWDEFTRIMKDFEPILEAVRVYYTYPRFDIEVTRGMNHLLKVPFSIHSKCRQISLPFPAEPIFAEYSIDSKVIRLSDLDRDESIGRFMLSECPNVDDLLAGKDSRFEQYKRYFARIVSHISPSPIEQPQQLLQ